MPNIIPVKMLPGPPGSFREYAVGDVVAPGHLPTIPPTTGRYLLVPGGTTTGLTDYRAFTPDASLESDLGTANVYGLTRRSHRSIIDLEDHFHGGFRSIDPDGDQAAWSGATQSGEKFSQEGGLGWRVYRSNISTTTWTLNQLAALATAEHPGVLNARAETAAGRQAFYLEGHWVASSVKRMTMLCNIIAGLTDVHYAFGLTSDPTAALASDGIWISFSNPAIGGGSNADWELVTRAAGVPSIQASGVAAIDAKWKELEFRQTAPGTWAGFIDNGSGSFTAFSGAALTTNIPTAKLRPFFVVESRAANPARLAVDYINLRSNILTGQTQA